MTLLSRVCETNAAYLALGNESWRAHDALFLRNRDTPRRRDANCVTLVRTENPEALDALFESLDSDYEGVQHRLFVIDPLTPHTFMARLALEDGYKHSEHLVQVLEGDLRLPSRSQSSQSPIEIKEVLSDGDWAAYMEMDAMWWRESGESPNVFGPYDLDLHEEMMRNVRLKSPAVRRWFALHEGVPRAFFASWPGENGIGMVEDLFCHPDYRRRGLATALLAHCVADARARGAGPVLINSVIEDTPKRMYAALGFRPLYVTRDYTKKLA